MTTFSALRSTVLQAIAVLAVGSSAFLAHAAVDSTPTHYIEVQAKNRDDRSLVSRLGYAIDEVRSDKIFFLGTPDDVTRLARLNLKAVARPLQERWFTMENSPNAARYTSYPEVVQQLKALEASNTSLVTLMSLGRSTEGRDIPMVRISSRSIAQAEGEKLPVVFYMGCHHAREHLSVEVPLMYAKYLVAQYATNPDIKRLLDTREVYIAPIINADGHVYDYRNGIRGQMWRKNRRSNGDGTYGVDLNRNYGWGWGTGGSSTDTSSDVYMGPAPFSEIETQNVKNFVDTQPRMTTLLTLHTFSELVLYPWGGTYDKIGEKAGNPSDYPVFQKMANDIAAWNKYTPEQSSDLYIASGDTTDWAYGTHGIFAFTFELSPNSMWGGGFYPSPNVIEPTFEANLKPMLYMLEFANNPHRVLTEKVPNFLQTSAKLGVGIASAQDLQY
ncbi:MAG: M14 family metallopeptidase [Bdellovibrionota bacterium]